MKPTLRCSRVIATVLRIAAVICGFLSVANAAVLAPNSIAGKVLFLNTTAGSGNFSSTGQMVMVLTDSGEGFAMLDLSTNSTFKEGMVAYTKTGDTTARMVVNDSESVVTAAITFTTPTNGTYRVTAQGSSGYQSGTFRLLNGAAVSDISGQVVSTKIMGGAPSYATNRMMEVHFNTDGTMTQTVVGSTDAESGLYTYSKVNRTCGFLEIGGPESGGTLVVLAFSDTRNGLFFSYEEQDGYEWGKFELSTPIILQGLTNITAVAGKNVTMSVKAAGTGSLTYQWYQNGNAIDGATNSTLVLVGVGAEQEGAYYVEVSNEFGTVGSNQIELSLLYPPTIVTQPISLTNYVGSFASFEVVASGNDPLKYQWRFNGTALKGQTASVLSLTNVHKSNAGSYTVSVTNAYGAVVSSAATLTVPAIYERLTVLTNGLGTVSSNIDGRWFEIGQALTLTAKPGAGSVFSNWSGTISSTNRTLTFEMQSNMVLQANFVPNPFLTAKGRYHGLFLENRVRNESSGFVTLNVTSNGGFSGSMLLAGRTNTFSGQFDLDGVAVVKVQRAGSVLTNTMYLGHEMINGDVTDGNWTAELHAYRVTPITGSPLTNLIGKWTMALPSGGSASNSPAGFGYATMSMDQAGTIRMSGSLADGTAISQSVPVFSKEPYWPLYIPLYGGKGVIAGWAEFDATNSFSAYLAWIKPALTNSQFYPAGFTNEVRMVGSKFITPPRGVRLLELTDATLLLMGGNLNSSITNALTLTTNNAAVISGTNGVKLTFNRTNGIVQGSFMHPITRKATTITGVVLQKDNMVTGYFRGTNQVGVFGVYVPSKEDL